MRVWTFEIRGGSPLTIEMNQSGALFPSLVHNGRRTVWKMVGSEEMAQQVESALRQQVPGCRVERHTEEQTPEQEAERLWGPQGGQDAPL